MAAAFELPPPLSLLDTGTPLVVVGISPPWVTFVGVMLPVLALVWLAPPLLVLVSAGLSR